LEIFVVGSAARNQALSREQALRTVSLSETCMKGERCGAKNLKGVAQRIYQ